MTPVDFAALPSSRNRQIHLVNVDVRDTHEDSEAAGSGYVLELVRAIDALEDLDDELDDCLEDFAAATGRAVLHSVEFV
jgi:hypothetical protein